MASHDDRENPPKTPQTGGPTTPQRTPSPSEETAELHLTEPSLTALSQRYDVLAEIGRGGMGVIYRARDRETGDVVALKVLRPEIASHPDLISRFKSELLLARKITHKNVCRMYELLRFGDTVAIAMEYLEGESLRSLLNRVEGLTVRHGLRILRQAMAGLAEAHAQGVVHRDLKPENILITRDGTVKVMDFGIARSVEGGTAQTERIYGTPAYMSPEQAEGKTADAPSDIYSLGLIVYEMFAGQPAFRAETAMALAYKQIHDTPTPARSVDPYLPAFLDRAIEKCLEKDPKKRFRSVAELEASLEEQAVPEVVEGEPVPAPHLSIWGRGDWLLLALGVVGLIYFLGFQETVFPALKQRLEVDAITARRAAENLAVRLGRPFPEQSKAQLEFKGERYRLGIMSKVSGILSRHGQGPHDLRGAIRQAELPVYWKVSFRGPNDGLFAALGEGPVRYAVLNRNGELDEFNNPYPPDWSFPSYQVPPVEQRRAVAKKAIEMACGPLPPDTGLVEYSGGEQGASYTATWRPRRPVGSAPWGEVSLLAENVVSVKCTLQGEAPGWGTLHIDAGWFFYNLSRLFLIFWVVAGMAYFGIGQCHRSPLLWKRLPLAAFLGLSGAWLLSPTFDQLPNTAATSPTPSMPVLLVGGLAGVGLILVGLVTSEYYLARRAPAWVASYTLAWKGRLGNTAVGLAVVRGALAGLALAGTQTLISHLSLIVAKFGNTPSREIGGLFGCFADPTGVGLAIASFSPALYVSAAAVFNGVILGLVALGSLWGVTGYREFLKYRNDKTHQAALVAGLAGNCLVLAVALRLHFGQVLGPGMGFFTVPFVLLLLATLLLVRYDVLTVTVAIATAVLWTLNYPLLYVFEEVGNASYWAVFVGWGAVVAAAAAVAFGPHLERARRRLKDEMQ